MKLNEPDLQPAEAADEYRGVLARRVVSLGESSSIPSVYLCAGPFCPGYGWEASEVSPHPVSCQVEGFDDAVHGGGLL